MRTFLAPAIVALIALSLASPSRARAIELADQVDGFHAVLDDGGGCVVTSTSPTATGACEGGLGSYLQHWMRGMRSGEAPTSAIAAWHGEQFLIVVDDHRSTRIPSEFDLDAYAARDETPFLAGMEAAVSAKFQVLPGVDGAHAERIHEIPTLFYERDFTGEMGHSKIHGRFFVREMFLEHSTLFIAYLLMNASDEHARAEGANRLDDFLASVRGKPAPMEPSNALAKPTSTPVNYARIAAIAGSSVGLIGICVAAYFLIRARTRRIEEQEAVANAQREAEEAALDPLEKRRRRLAREG